MIFTRAVKNKKGFTLVEILFAASLSLLIIGATISAWIFSNKAWSIESVRTSLRVDMMKALETIKTDLRLSSLTYMTFYPEGAGPYSAVSLPVAIVDNNGLFQLNANGEIDWDRTVIYHIFTDNAGNSILRRTVFDPRDNDMTEEERYAELEGVVTNGVGGSGSVTDEHFLQNIETFEILSISPVVDFYEESAIPVKSGKTVFGWARLAPGDHIVRFEVTGKNDLSSGYSIGIDRIMIEPSGSARDVEYYASSFAPSGAMTVNGGATALVNGPLWGNDNYLEYDPSGVGDYVEFKDYYDLWRESDFGAASLSNVARSGDEARAVLEVPTGDEDGKITWYSYIEANDSVQEGQDGTFPASGTPPVTVRTLISGNNIDVESNLIRVKFKAASSEDLTIANAYITKKDDLSSEPYDGLPNQSPAGPDVEDYHRHQQLFFKDTYDIDGDGETDEIISSLRVPAGSEGWSEWTAFPLRTDSDYFVTYFISASTLPECRYWVGTSGTQRTFYRIGGSYTTAGTPVWRGGGFTVNSDENIYAVTNIDTWEDQGTVESQIFDTTMEAPVYNQIRWSADSTAGTAISFKARSSVSQYMEGATDWGLITGSASNPHTLSIGNERYVQFMAELSTEIFWQTESAQMEYDQYIESQIGLPVYEFPNESGEPYVTGCYSTWVDDVAIDWPGNTRICTITGYIARKEDYGQAKVTVDGTELVKIMSIHVIVSRTSQNRSVEEENYIEIQPRNTGK